ncbi:MAG: hypothetical protein HXM38_05390 [Isoptericola variabilis]|nr:hypothetical protein [Isoptericola variabilis]
MTDIFPEMAASQSVDDAVGWGASDKVERNVVLPHSACCLLVSLGLASG